MSPLLNAFPSKLLNAEGGGSMSDHIKIVCSGPLCFLSPCRITQDRSWMRAMCFCSASMKPYEWNPMIGPRQGKRARKSARPGSHIISSSPTRSFLFKFRPVLAAMTSRARGLSFPRLTPVSFRVSLEILRAILQPASLIRSRREQARFLMRLFQHPGVQGRPAGCLALLRPLALTIWWPRLPPRAA